MTGDVHERAGRADMARRGFTLIELLVVMAVIMLLAALLSPMVRRSISMAVSTQCQTNLRQLGVGMQMYSNNWSMYILPAYSTYRDPASGAERWITFRHAPGFDYWWHGVGREDYLWPQYVQDTKVFICPNNESSRPEHSCSYTHNWTPWNGQSGASPAQRKVQKVGDPQRTIIVTESSNPVIWDWNIPEPSFDNTPNSLFDRLLDRHGTGEFKGPNCLYMDGRANWRKRLELDIPDFTPIADHDR